MPNHVNVKPVCVEEVSIVHVTLESSYTDKAAAAKAQECNLKKVGKRDKSGLYSARRDEVVQREFSRYV